MISLFCKWNFRNKLLLLLEARSSSSSSRSNDHHISTRDELKMRLWACNGWWDQWLLTYNELLSITSVGLFLSSDNTKHRTVQRTKTYRNKTYNKHITIYNVSSSSSNKSTTAGCPVLVVFNASQLMISEKKKEGTETEIKE